MNDFAVDVAGNVHMVGVFGGTVDFDPGAAKAEFTAAGYRDVFILKLDPSGAFLWGQVVGGTSNDVDAESGNAIALDGDGNVYTTGHFQGTLDFDPGEGVVERTSAGCADIFVLKLDASGAFVWARSMGGSHQIVLEKSEACFTDIGFAIASDTLGNVYTTGQFYGLADFDPGDGVFNLNGGSGGVFIQKLTPDGDFAWARAMGEGGVLDPDGDQVVPDVGRGIAVDGIGNVYTTGQFVGTVDFDPGDGRADVTSQGYYDVFVQKLNADGHFEWIWSAGAAGSESSPAIVVDSGENLFVSGFASGVADFDPGVETEALQGAGGYVLKLDSEGDFVWVRSAQGRDVALDGAGDLYLAGGFEVTVDLDPGEGVAEALSQGETDAFIQRLDAAGQLVWAKAIGGTGADSGTHVAVDGAGHVYSAGYFEQSVDFDPGAGTVELASASATEVFVVRFDPDTASPGVASIIPAIEGPSNASAIDFTVTFSEAVLLFDGPEDVVVTHAGTDSTGIAITGGPVVYTVSVSGISGDGSFTLAVSEVADVQDAAGNLVSERVDSDAVLIDNTPPMITVVDATGPANVVDCGGVYSDAGATASDGLNGALEIAVSGAVDSNTPGEYIITYSALDAAGNESTATRTVAVLDNCTGGEEADAIIQALLDGFSTADDNGDGVLSFAEASGFQSALTQTLFDAWDSGNDQVLSRAELRAVAGGASGCTWPRSGMATGFREHLGGIFLLGLSLVVLLAATGHGKYK
ncbi:MAG: DUF5011 domain-containing protein [Candidatus Hydrogenedentes bacterium]|nr:DUF5011 domain-containing protein [Candidatus Hydrogenedentota bacterium]